MLTAQQARKILGPYEKQFSDVLYSAWDEYLSDYGKRHVHSARTRSNVVYDLILVHLDRVFGLEPHCRIVRHNGMIALHVKGRILIKFKKLDRNKRSSNYPTQQAVQFEAQLPIPGLGFDSTYLVIGYRLDPLATALIDCWVTCPDGDKLAWSYELPRRSARRPRALPFPQRELPLPVTLKEQVHTRTKRRE